MPHDSADQHHLMICTLCSCYPLSILGQPTSWYISKAYRARSVREPRKVLHEFALDLPTDMQLTVHDSNADMRFWFCRRCHSGRMVLEQKPLTR